MREQETRNRPSGEATMSPAAATPPASLPSTRSTRSTTSIASSASAPPAIRREATLRALALTVEAAGDGGFRWRILENTGRPAGYESIACAAMTFSAYDAALATGYGALQRLIGADLQHGPRVEPQAPTAAVPHAEPPASFRPSGGAATSLPGMPVTTVAQSPKVISA